MPVNSNNKKQLVEAVPAVQRIVILKEIYTCFAQMRQWLTTPNSYADYFNKALVLIEVLEALDCGSIGGFDDKNLKVIATGFNEYNRFLTLLNKYPDIKVQIYPKEITQMTKFWNKITQLRCGY